MSSVFRRSLLLGTILLPFPSFAQEAAQLSPVVVTAPLPQTSQADLVEGSSVLTGEELDRRRAATLGETLQGLPGVSSSAFGPGAGRPIIRGQGGPRVRVMQNGLDTFDAATVSPDHAVAAPMGGVQRVEVLRGPSTLLYGSSAIGGVVNVIDGRIPDSVPKNGVSGPGIEGRARLDYGSAAQEKSGFAGIDAAVTDKFVVHGEAGALTADDYRAGGGRRIDNSAMRSQNGAIGASYLGDSGYAGASLSRLSSYYGIPGDEAVHIDLQQTRLDTRFGLYDPLPVLEEVKLKVGYANYLHDEIEPDGQPATRFDNDSWEARLEAIHTPLFGGNDGVIGVQTGRRDFSARGEEAYLPANVTDSNALFLLERFDTGSWLFALGGRIEHVEIDNLSDTNDRDYTPASLSASATWRFTPGWQAGAAVSYTERAPTAEELYANGAHLATRSFEIGNVNLGKEAAWHSEVSLRKVQGDLTGGINVFATRYKDYIYGAFTGNQQDDLNELQISQTDADFRGVEVDAAWNFWRDPTKKRRMGIDGGVDFVRAEDRSNSANLPLIPPLGYRLGFVAEQEDIGFRLELAGVARQDRAGANETTTDGYRVINAAVTWRPFSENRNVALLLQGRNLTDEEGRLHTSMLKEQAPIRGREVRLGGSVTF
ncbi:TonB-dependent receptor [Ferrovibrio terrae]|uniref:TonB-dependent receptor n=1 Tax=Ferrovibrio terrae TaxID=2594003 RepID=A0A516GZC4_9PROT|nr:TonB-dependent receptor [Ferrovibrio terrae]QDO96881.1 TonB-dependent receptor [Ferrovibrio terrae]